MGPSKRVLVVDDCADTAESLAMLVRLWGHEVWAAHDGPSALAAAEAHRPEVILLDIGLPGMSGHEVARQLRTLMAGRPLLLVAITGFGREQDRQRSREAGFDVHILKPFDPNTLKALLAEAPSAAPLPRDRLPPDIAAGPACCLRQDNLRLSRAADYNGGAWKRDNYCV
jgi:CheY-like chemotaxis protein